MSTEKYSVLRWIYGSRCVQRWYPKLKLAGVPNYTTQHKLCSQLQLSQVDGYNNDLNQLKLTLSVYRKTSCFTMTTELSMAIPGTGRLTSSNDPTSFGLLITRLIGELLADTTQITSYIQITWKPRLKTLTSSETNPGWDRAVDGANMSTSGEMSVWIAQREPGMKKGISLCLSTVPYKETVISMGTCQTQPYQTRTTLVCITRSIPNFDVPKPRCNDSVLDWRHFMTF